MWKTWVQSLGWEDPLEKGKAIHSSILTWRIPWTVESQRVGHNRATSTFRAIVKDREAWHATVHGVAELDTNQKLNNNKGSKIYKMVTESTSNLRTQEMRDK